MKTFIVLFWVLPLVSVAQTDTLVAKTLTSAQMQQDFQYLRKILTETHPGLYRYSSTESMTHKMDSLYQLLNKPMPFYEFYLMLSHLVSNIRCAHTFVSPTKDLQTFYMRNVKTFPLNISFTENKYYITLNGTSEHDIEPGFELLSINGKSMMNIRRHLQKYLWADGHNEMGKAAVMEEMYFPLFYYLLVERPNSFDIVYKDKNGVEHKTIVLPQSFNETRQNFRKNKVNHQLIRIAGRRNRLDAKRGWRLTIQKNENVGVMRISGFGEGKDEKEAQQKIRSFLDECMTRLRADKIDNLIIDLRYNPGGWDIQGVELFTYLIDKPTRCYQRLHAVTDSSEFFQLSDLSAEDLRNVKKELREETDGTFSVREEFSEQLRMQQPKPNRFKGKVYILANRGSGSTASEFLAYTKSNKVATIIGEECNGAYEGGNGGSFLHFALPNSKVYFGTPLLSYENAVTPVEPKGRGTMPDYDVPYKMEDLLSGRDTQLDFALQLIRQTKVK